jgi:hypothetical protein
MIEITNKTRGPVQLIVRSMSKEKNVGHAFTCLNIPGIGAGKNVYLLEDERYTDYIDRAEEAGFITQKRVTKIKK